MSTMRPTRISHTDRPRQDKRDAEAPSFLNNDFLTHPMEESVDYENLYLFETRLSDLQKLVPKGTQCLRISESKGLFGLGMQNFPAGQFDFTTEQVRKIYALIAVDPDYSIKMATPRFCFFTLSVSTTDAGFNAHTDRVNKYPIYESPDLTIQIDHDHYTAYAADTDGPIFEIDTPFKHRNFSDISGWGQNVTLKDGNLYWQAWNWDGRGVEFFLNKMVGKFYPHPFFRGIDTTDLKCRHIFAARAGHVSTMRLYQPVYKESIEKEVDLPLRFESKAFSDSIDRHVQFPGSSPKSAKYFRQLSQYLAGGVHYNFHGFPLKHLSKLITHGKGSRVWDGDGREYLDLYGKFGAMFLGHGHERYNQRLKECIDQITVVDSSGLEYEAARRLQEVVPAADLVRFSLSGTEAVQNAIRLARAFTGKSKIVRFYGHYHGNADNTMGGKATNFQTPHPEDYVGDLFYTEGRAKNVFRDQMYITTWNETSLLEVLLEEHQSEIAAVLMEPICVNGGGILPKANYLSEVAELCRQHGVLLIFDEVITGIRCGLGGAQAIYGVTPDITVYGKAVGGGAVPVSAIMGRREVMDVYTEFRAVHGGTFNGYPLGMAAILATLDVLEAEDDYFSTISQSADRIAKAFLDAAADHGVPLAIQGPPTGLTFHISQSPLDSSLQFTKTQLKKNMLLNIVALEHGIMFSPVSRMYSNLQLCEADVVFFQERIDDVMRAYSQVYEAVVD